MAHVSLNQLETATGFRSSDNTTYPDIETALRELQGLKFGVSVGVASGSAASLTGDTGITSSDTIVATIGLTNGATFVYVDTSVSLSGTDTIQFDSNNATGLSCLTFWCDKSGA